MSTYSVKPAELTQVAGTIALAAKTVSGAASEVNVSALTATGLPKLDSVLGELASSLGGWLTTAGQNVETLAYNTQIAGAVYDRAEADTVKSASPSPPPTAASCPPTCVA